MKKILVSILIIGVGVPSLVLADMHRSGKDKLQGKRTRLEMLKLMHDADNTSGTKKDKLELKKFNNSNQSTNSNESLTNQGPVGPKSLPTELQNKPKDLASGLEQHAEAIEFKLSHLEDSQIPEDKQEIVREHLEAELAWIEAMQAKVAEAESEEEKQALVQETREHLQQQRQERQQKLAQAAQLPEQSPFVFAQSMGERMQKLLEHLQTQDVDTTELAAAIADYNQAVSDGQTLFERLSENKSYDQLVAVRDQMMLVKEKGQAIRNLLQSLLKPEN